MPQKLYFGIDVGGTFTKIALVDGKNRLISKSKISSERFSKKPFFVKAIKESLHSILRSYKLSAGQVRGLGIGLPGPVDSKRGVVLNLPNIKGWNNFPLKDLLVKRFNLPVFTDNDANCMALAEQRMGAAKGYCYALCMTLGTGVGCGIILDGKIYRGPYFLGGEIGHFPIDDHGPKCRCGGNGCLEKYVGNNYLVKKASHIFGKGISLEQVSALAASGNRKAINFWEDTGTAIGLVIAGIANAIGPEVVVVGGGVAGAGSVLLGAIRETVKRHAMHEIKNKIKIKRALLGNDAGVLGAALLAREDK